MKNIILILTNYKIIFLKKGSFPCCGTVKAHLEIFNHDLVYLKNINCNTFNYPSLIVPHTWCLSALLLLLPRRQSVLNLFHLQRRLSFCRAAQVGIPHTCRPHTGTRPSEDHKHLAAKLPAWSQEWNPSCRREKAEHFSSSIQSNGWELDAERNTYCRSPRSWSLDSMKLQ